MNINQFLKQLSTGDEIRDYQHASKLFVSDNYKLSPKYGFLYHVAFDLAPGITKTPTTEQMELGMLVKAVNLPSFKIDVKTQNAYNRVNLTQTKVNYDPVRITFHDDSADVVRNFWYDYFSYFYRDSDYVEPMYRTGHKYQLQASSVFGYTPRSYNGGDGQLQFINSIRIYSLHQKRFSEYTLINPIISNFKHGDHRADAGDSLMEHEMQIEFETVKYATGYVTEDSVKGFGTLHYDKTPSPLTPAGGGTQSIAGPGGLLDTADSIVSDLAEGNFGAAALTAARATQNFKGADIGGLAKGYAVSTGIGMGLDLLSGQNPMDRLSAPINLAKKIGSTATGLTQGTSASAWVNPDAPAGSTTIGGVSNNVSSNGDFLSSVTQFGKDTWNTVSNYAPSLPSTSGTTWSNPLNLVKTVESSLRANPSAPAYTGTDPIVRARLGLPPLEYNGED